MESELKTMQDIMSDVSCDECGFGISHIRRDTLRKEAKKWYHRSDSNKHKFIKEFFNLSDEDVLLGESE